MGPFSCISLLLGLSDDLDLPGPAVRCRLQKVESSLSTLSRPLHLKVRLIAAFKYLPILLVRTSKFSCFLMRR